ncbi:MAG: ankyrin repeat domain-containing protein [Acidobacteria bacterium]|nr:ankyrin repeat domain-containing protein [Acidobacteriota bacterium]
MLDAGADPNDGETPYHSVEHDGVPCLDLLWEHFNEDSRSIAIQHKVDFPDAAGLRLLLELGADPNARRFFDRPPLHGCVFRGHDRELFETLLEFGADPNLTDQSGRTPYALAARAGQQEIMKILVENGAMLDLKPTDRFLSACALGDAETVAAMLEETPDIVERLDDDRTVICEVAANGNTTGVRVMLEAGFDVNTPGSVWREGPIHRAATGGHLDTVKLLYERGADLTMRDASYSASPLGWGEHGGHVDIVDFLQRDASRLDLRDALEWGKTERVAELLGDTDVDAPIAGAEPGVLLRSAAYGGQLPLVAMLLEKGADRDLRNSDGMTALDYATTQGHAEVAELLRQEPKTRRS